MTPNEFDFTLQMPGDERLLGAIRQLTAHAAGYAQLSTEAGELLAVHVQRATEAAIAASKVQRGPIEFRFYRDGDALVVAFSCDASPAAKPPRSVADAGVTVDWTVEGNRHTCRIRQPQAGA
jgi:hypothetical protein